MKFRRELVKLCQIKEINAYLEQLSKISDCLIILTCKDTLGYELTQEIADQICKLGLKAELHNKHWRGYIGILDSGKIIYEELSEPNKEVRYAGKLEHLYIEVKSSPYCAGNETYIDINNVDYAVNDRGINLVVYDHFTRQVVDSICVDTHSKNYSFKRKNVNLRSKDRLWILLMEQQKMLEQLCVKSEKSENNPVCHKFTREEEEIKKRLYLPALLSINIEKKKKVRLLFWGGAYLWNVMETVALAFQQDKNYDVLVILYREGWIEEKEKRVKEADLCCCTMKEYQIELDSPDILLFFPGYNMEPFLWEDFIKFRQFVKLIIAIPICLVKFDYSPIENFIEKVIQSPVGKLVDYYLYDNLLYYAIKNSRLAVENVINIGNPKFDILYQVLNGIRLTSLPKSWEKLNGKKVLLWTTDHEWNLPNVTFDLYANQILSFFKQHSEYGLIFRPHPIYLVELIKNGIWSEKDLENLRNFFAESSNMVMDEQPEYAFAYRIADAVLADMNCGISVSALVLDKPIGILSRFDGRKCNPAHPEVIEKEYLIENTEQCEKFLHLFLSGTDPRKEDRKECRKNSIKHFDGKNGQRIKEWIEEKM